jgi:hypothetical protein
MGESMEAGASDFGPATYASYVREVLGASSLLAPGECSLPAIASAAAPVATVPEAQTVAPQETGAVAAPAEERDFGGPAILARGNAGARLAFVSVHAEWPIPGDAAELRRRIFAAMKVDETSAYALEARRPQSASQAREVARELKRALRESGALIAVCFGRWALACAMDDPSLATERSMVNFGDFAPTPSGDGSAIRFLLTHALEDLGREQSLKKEAWKHLQQAF